MRIEFQHFRDTKNIGDASCSPYDWLTWSHDVNASDIRKESRDYDVSVIGGGKIFGGLSKYDGIQKDKRKLHIAWGVSTVQSFPISLKYSRARKICDLVGTRDWGDKRFQWAPCVTCLSPKFEEPLEPEHDVVFYYHAGKTEKQGIEIPDNIPSMSNNVESLDKALDFIASGKTVVSNSYHGVYWSLLMGRKTLCVPFSNKFSHYRFAPGFAKPSNWLKSLHSAQQSDSFLKVAREATHDFHEKVMQKITEHHK